MYPLIIGVYDDCMFEVYHSAASCDALGGLASLRNWISIDWYNEFISNYVYIYKKLQSNFKYNNIGGKEKAHSSR